MLTIANKTFNSNLLLGTGKFSNSLIMSKVIQITKTEMVTVSIKRIDLNEKQDSIITPLKKMGIHLLPNTSGAKNAEEAVFAAHLASNALETNWIKLEIHPDTKYLFSDSYETLKAAKILVKEKFIVLPYCNPDPVLCKNLEDIGCAAVMPLGAPIGSCKGLLSYHFLKIIIEQSNIPVIIDAGLGLPSHALTAMELGADGILVNTAIATSKDPINMAKSFKIALDSGNIVQPILDNDLSTYQAYSTSPLTNFF
ncbi:MAG: thiazole synthase [Arsenophonus sp.]|nr:MAG: thiazole synthase [Arsenophonus sp.]